MVIGGFDYYVVNINHYKYNYYIDDSNIVREVITNDKIYWNKRLDYKSIVATNNPNSIIPKIIDEYSITKFEYYEKRRNK